MPKLQTKISIESLEPLIEELMREKPSEIKIKKMMVDQGLQYTNDPIQQMSVILSVMSEMTPQIRRKKSAEMVEL